jgi:carbonic anhydrase/acetyltransferase-like protein (isoleucine patch superfamily)
MKRFFPGIEAPDIAPDAFVAPGAAVIGGVKIGPRASIWYHCAIRGDINKIEIGADSNIQDGTVIHVADDHPAIIGERVSVGHRAIIHACEIGDETLVGMGAIVMDGAVIGARCVVAAGSLVTKNTRVPEGSLVMGSPAKVVRCLTPEEQKQNVSLAAKYVEISRRYLALGMNA